VTGGCGKRFWAWPADLTETEGPLRAVTP